MTRKDITPQLLALGVLGGGGAPDPLSRLLTQFPGGDTCFITAHISGAYTTYALNQMLGDGLAWNIKMTGAQIAIGYQAVRIDTSRIVEFYRGYNDQTTPAVTGTVYKSSSVYQGGRELYGSSAGQYAEVTTDDGVSWVGAIVGYGYKGGCFKVTIDGNATAADLLPTAQDLVDSTALASTVLVANGGTLNPTDRILNVYNFTNTTLGPGAGYPLVFTRSLTPGIHTVRITNTGYHQSDAAAYAGIALLIAGGPLSGGPSSTSHPVIINKNNVAVDASMPIWEISYSTIPTGATNSEWIGHIRSPGGEKYLSLPVITIDGTPVSLSHGQYAIGSIIEIASELASYHAEIDSGTTPIATLDMSYIMRASSGLDIDYTLAWSTAGTVVGYPGMLGVDHAVFDRFNTQGNTAIDLLDNNSSYKQNSSGNYCFCWDYDGYAAAVMVIKSLDTVDNWEHSPVTRFTWGDVSTSVWKKSYPFRFSGGGYAFSNGEIWTSSINYRVNWIAAGANLMLEQLR